MKKTIQRLCCATVLLGIGLTVCAGWVSNVTAVPTQEAAPFWLQVLILADNGLSEAMLCTPDGTVLEQLQFGTGRSALSRLIPPGAYCLDTALGTVEFSIDADAVISTTSPLAWTDGEQLHLTRAEVGAVRVLCSVPENQWREFCLQGDADTRQQILWADGAAEFLGLPFGSYTLLMNGDPIQKLTLTAKVPTVLLDFRDP